MKRKYTAEEIRALIQRDELEAFYNSKYWRGLSAEIIKENHGECAMCKAVKKLTPATLVHHVKHLRDYPELAYERTCTDETGEHIQLMPLCHDCHERAHKRGIYAEPAGFTNEEKW